MKTVQVPAEISRTNMTDSLRNLAAAHFSNMLKQLEILVRAESPSDDKAAVDRASGIVAGWLEALGGKVRWRRQRAFGDLLEVQFPASGSAAAARSPRARPRPVLLLGHIDTVWPLGTLRSMPFRVAKSRAFGPGVFDMKAGIVMAVHAIAILKEANLPHPSLVLLFNTDEEIGSDCSRAVTEEIARRCSAVFVLEPALGLRGAYKTSRKGVGQYSVRVRGVAAHSGVDFENGHSAVLEMARLLEKISGFTDLKHGITVNPGLIRGGSRVNIVAAEAEAEVDVRIARARDAARLERLFHSLRPADRACSIQVSGGVNRPPMERGAGTSRLFQQAKDLASEIGFPLEEASTGGGSDGNFTAALGIPTLDGMGAVGEGAHAVHESIQLDALAPRTALLAAMIASQLR
jgi:glutamate carboxypeptidase